MSGGVGDKLETMLPIQWSCIECSIENNVFGQNKILSYGNCWVTLGLHIFL